MGGFGIIAVAFAVCAGAAISCMLWAPTLHQDDPAGLSDAQRAELDAIHRIDTPPKN